MRLTKIIVLWSLGSLLAMIAGAVVFLAVAGDDFYRWALRTAIEGRVEREVRIDGSFSFAIGLEPAVTVTDIWVANAPWARRTELARADRVEIQIALRPLLSGVVVLPRLKIEGLRLDLETSPEGQQNWKILRTSPDAGGGATAGGVTIPLLDHVSLTDITITHKDTERNRDTVVVLDSLTKQQATQDDQLDIRGAGSLNGQRFQISGRSGSIDQALAARTPFPFELSLEALNVVASLTGSARNLAAGEGLDARVTMRTPAVQEVARTFGTELAVTARAEATARLQGDLDSLAAEDIAFELIGDSGHDLRAVGRIADIVAGTGLDLRITGALAPEAPQWIGGLPARLRQVLDDATRVEIIGSLAGDFTAPRVENLRARLQYGSGGTLSVAGRAALDLSETGRRLKEFEARTSLSLPDPTVLERLLDVSLPDLGSIDAAADVAWTGEAVLLRSAEVKFGDGETLRVTADGTLGTLRPDSAALVEQPALAVRISMPSSRMFAHLLPARIPEFREVLARFDVTGDPDAVAIANAHITAKGPDGLAATVSGGIAEITFAAGLKQRGLALDVDARWPTSKGLSGLFGLDVPDLGPVQGRGRVTDREGALALTIGDLVVGGSDEPAVRVSGEIRNLFAAREIVLDGEFEIPTAKLLQAGSELQASELGRVQGKFELSNTDGSLGLEALSAETEGTTLLSLSIKGLFDDIERRDELLLQADLAVPDLAQLGRELGFQAERLGRFSFKGEVSGSDERFRAEGTAQLGKTDVTGTLSGTLTGARPALKATLSSPLIRFADLGLVPGADAPETVSAAVPAPPGSERVFNDLPIGFETLKRFDLDLDVRFDHLEGLNLYIDKAEGRAELIDGVLRVDRFRNTYVGGRVDLSLFADANKDPPEVRLGLTAVDLNLGDFLSQRRVNVPLYGKLDLLVDLRATGRSPQDLASSLDGEVNLAIERGQILTSLLDLTTTNPASWLFSESARRGYSEMNCLIVRFDVEDGIANSRTLLLDTANVLAIGAGRIDLRREWVDIEVSPQAKRRRLVAISTPFAIRGPLAGPSVEVSPGGVAVRSAGKVLVSPINTLGSLLPIVRSGGSDEDKPCLKVEGDVVPR